MTIPSLPQTILGLVLGSAVLAGCVTDRSAAPSSLSRYGRALPAGAPALLPSDDWPLLDQAWTDRAGLERAVAHSLTFLDAPSSRGRYPMAGITHERARNSLLRFRELLAQHPDPAGLGVALRSEFDLFVSAGWDGRGGGVLFTAYCTPELEGRLTRGGRFQHPLYGLPDDLVKGAGGEILGQRTPDGGLRPYPTRRELQSSGALAGRELVWLGAPLDAYLAHVNGSALVRLSDGRRQLFGYAGKNGRDYHSLRQALIDRGEIDPDASGLPALREWASGRSEREVLDALAINESFVFFTAGGDVPRGSLGVPVTAERSLATDKSLFPPGALTIVDTALPRAGSGRVRPFTRILLDQDTGGAIRTAGRADIYLGEGDEAERRAGVTAAEGQLFYLFLKPGRSPLGR